MATGWAFDTDFTRPDEVTGANVELFRRSYTFGDVTFALLDRQTNTYSSILTGDVISREAPRLAFMVGTALGNPNRVRIGSVVVSDGVVDISEKRYGDSGQGVYVVRGPTRADAITHDARDYIARVFTAARTQYYVRAMARTFPVVRRDAKQVPEFIDTFHPRVICEEIISGNEYRMTSAEDQLTDVWSQNPRAAAYDMEAAGFVLAADCYKVPWLVVRGISDYGTRETKSDFNRTIATGIAARFLRDFIMNGLVRVEDIHAEDEPGKTLSLLRDEVYRLDGAWCGAMAYLDDQGQPVVFEDKAQFEQSGRNVDGVISSRKIRGRFKHDRLEYRANFSIAKHGYAGGIWSDTTAARQYFGVLLGQFQEGSDVLGGIWLGTHKEGLRPGLFKWYNLERDGEVSQAAIDISAISEELIAGLQESFFIAPSTSTTTQDEDPPWQAPSS